MEFTLRDDLRGKGKKAIVPNTRSFAAGKWARAARFSIQDDRGRQKGHGNWELGEGTQGRLPRRGNTRGSTRLG